MDLDPTVCEAARRSRDPRFDGRFFIAVVTTGIYCRPVCPAPSPRERNVLYFPTAAAAAESGFRPCLRCRPETSPGAPAWLGTSISVSRALRLIGELGLAEESIEDLAAHLGLGARQLRRLFLQHLGASPVAVVQTRRIHFAKTLIDETNLPFTQVAMASGFGSVRRFNASFRKLYQRTPSEIRRLARTVPLRPTGRYAFRLLFRPPFDWRGLLNFLAPRAIPGVEQVDGESYRRVISFGEHAGQIEAKLARARNAIELMVDFPDVRHLMLIVERTRRMFDLQAEPASIASVLQRDAAMAGRLHHRPGLRVPGAWDGFELSVRAILGQQVTVKGATTLAGRIVRAFGRPVEFGGGLTHIFPTPRVLAEADLTSAGLTRSRANTIRQLALAVANGELDFTKATGSEGFLRRLRAVPGVGDWTVQYIAMRALGEPDAFPASDLGLLRASGVKTAKELEELSNRWRPWRAYAAMQLWQGEA
jgi:AraC family transcriptional regulator of adaptative response / DNA-3-methyladenine glycosylase II